LFSNYSKKVMVRETKKFVNSTRLKISGNTGPSSPSPGEYCGAAV
jgi:hypothetical protein